VKKPAVSAVKAENVVALGVRRQDHPWRDLPAREISAEAWQRFRGYVGEIFEALGMDLDTPGTRRPYFEAPYAALPGTGTTPAIDPMKTMRPPP
jgi:hypothetical protein